MTRNTIPTLAQARQIATELSGRDGTAWYLWSELRWVVSQDIEEAADHEDSEVIRVPKRSTNDRH